MIGALRRLAPQSFAGQTLAVTVLALLAAQLLSLGFFTIFVLKPQAERVAGIIAQSVAAASDAAELSTPEARAAIVARLDASEYLDVWPAGAAPPSSGPRPRLLEQMFMQALADALSDRSAHLLWRTDGERRLWMKVGIGPDSYWFSARSPRAMQPLAALGASAVVTFVVSLLVVVVLQRRITQPLSDLTAAVEAVGAEAAPPAVTEAGPRELVALSRGFNAMSARLAAADEERALMLAGVSHDVRTPLAKLRLAIEMLAQNEDDLGRAAHMHVQEIDRILSKFLMFARGFEAEAAVTFDLDALLSEIVASHAANGIGFALTGRAGEFHGRPEALRRALLNLTENALRHGASPYVVRAKQGDGVIELAVCDGGVGIAEESQERLLMPFVRGDFAPGAGTGLGLAIAERVAALHGGAIRFARPAGGGFEARLILPEA